MGFYTHETEFEGRRGFVTVGTLQDVAETMVKYPHKDQNFKWYGNVTAEQCYRNALNGHTQYLHEVDTMLGRLNQTVNVETQGYVIDNAVTGFIPDVPSAIQNLPESMVTVEATQQDFAPITIWVNIGASSGVDANDMATKGAAVCALISKIQAIRPVVLNLVMSQLGRETNDYLVIPIQANPVNLASLSYAICAPGFFRHSLEWFIRVRGTPRHCPWEKIYTSEFHSNGANKEYHRVTLGMLGGDTEHDIYVPILYLGDSMTKNPVGWIESKLEKYLAK